MQEPGQGGELKSTRGGPRKEHGPPPRPGPGSVPRCRLRARHQPPPPLPRVGVVSSPPSEDHRFTITRGTNRPRSRSMLSLTVGRSSLNPGASPRPLAPPTSSLIGVEARRLPLLHRDWCVFSFGPPPRARKRSTERGAEVGTRRVVARKLWPWFAWC